MMPNKMTKKTALKTLNISEDMYPSEETIKKSYRSMALKYHPDKNKSEDAKTKFIEIQEAYTFLQCSQKTGIDGPESNTDYISMMQSFLKGIFDEESHKIILFELMRKIVGICEKKAVELLQHIDKHILKKIYDIMVLYDEIFHFSEEFVDSIRDIVKTKFESDERIILHPFIDDLFDNNLYKLVAYDHTYIVPLWHHHLVYDIDSEKKTEIFVDCYPILPDNVFIDEHNNIHISIVKQMSELWKANATAAAVAKEAETATANATVNSEPKIGEIEFSIGSRIFTIKIEELFIKEKQTKILQNRGIPLINNNDLYDVTKNSDIIVYIQIE